MARRLTTEEFIEKARAVHSGKYSYDRTVYVRASDKVTITCPVHGDFLQSPAHHLQGAWCAKCRLDSYTLSVEDFIDKAREVHGSLYGYEQVVRVSAADKVTITCPEHGDFEQSHYSHLQGRECPDCQNKGRLSPELFINKALEVHGSRYDYSSTAYIHSRTKIKVGCKHHGLFRIYPNKHLQGDGCPKCSSRGFNPDKPAYLYILLDTETHSRVKIGISNVPDKRLSQLKNHTPFSIERIDLFETPPEITLLIEKFCHSQMESSGLGGFDGATEWFKFEGGVIEALREFIKSCGGAHV